MDRDRSTETETEANLQRQKRTWTTMQISCDMKKPKLLYNTVLKDGQLTLLKAREHVHHCAIVKTSPGTAVSQMDAKALPGETQSESLQCRTAGPQGTMRQQVRDPPAVKAGPREG